MTIKFLNYNIILVNNSLRIYQIHKFYFKSTIVVLVF